MMKTEKSRRQGKITGDFGKTVVMYWLSKHRYNVAKVDFTGIDLIAYNRKTKERLGITVRGSSRSGGKGDISVSLPRRREVFEACSSFACMPYIAVIVDSTDKGNKIKFYLLPWSEMKNIHTKGGRRTWIMRKKYLEKYEKSPRIKKITFTYDAKHRIK